MGAQLCKAAPAADPAATQPTTVDAPLPTAADVTRMAAQAETDAADKARRDAAALELREATVDWDQLREVTGALADHARWRRPLTTTMFRHMTRATRAWLTEQSYGVVVLDVLVGGADNGERRIVRVVTVSVPAAARRAVAAGADAADAPPQTTAVAVVA
jgi:hypothetical protein